MSYIVRFTEGADRKPGDVDESFYLCERRDWTKLIEWVKTLDDTQFPKLKELITNGTVKNSEAFGEELHLADTDEHMPKDAGVGFILAMLQEHVGTGDAEEVVSVHDE
jgi:hypothetical protein